MSIWNKVLVGLIAVAALGFCYATMRTLKTQQYWRELVEDFKKRIAEVHAQNARLREGQEEEGKLVALGIRQTRLELEKVLLDRGRVWYNCTPEATPLTAQTGEVRVTTDLPDPHGITVNTVLYVFEQQPVEDGGAYLGPFVVDQVAAKQVALKPAFKFEPGELQRLSRSAGPWVMYEKLPVDNYYLFADLDEDQLRKLLPAASVEDYLRHGEAAGWEDVEQWGVDGMVVDENGVPLMDEQGQQIAGRDGVFQRRLRDYAALLHAAPYGEEYDAHIPSQRSQLTLLTDLIASMERDVQYMQAAAADAKKQVTFRENEKAALEADLAKIRAERDAVAAHRQRVEQKLGELKAAVEQMLEQNRTMAGQIARIQLEAARQIEQRARAMAQSGEEGG